MESDRPESDGSAGDTRVAESAPAYFEGLDPEHRYMTVDEYLAFEQASTERHEYVNGMIHAMAGTTRQHEVIAGNIFAAIHAHVRGGPCRPYAGNLKLRLHLDRRDFFYYPDIMVGCTQDGVEDSWIRFPCVIVEVLSTSTQAIDRREKYMNYLQVPSVREYFLVSQLRLEIVVFRRDDDWKASRIADAAGTVEFKSIELTLPIAQVYEGVL